MSGIKREAIEYAESFISLFNDHREHANSVLEVRRLDYGQVGICLRDSRTQQIARELLTPVRFNPVGIFGLVCASMKRDTSPSGFISNLFFKVLGLPHTKMEEVDTVSSVFSSASEKLKAVVKELEQHIPVYQIARILREAPTLEALNHFCYISPCQCSLFYEGAIVPCGEKNYMLSSLLLFLQSRAMVEPDVSIELLRYRIAHDEGVFACLYRALVLGTSEEVSAPICKFLERYVPADGKEWKHEFSYEIRIEQQPRVVQRGYSRILFGDGAIMIKWTLEIQFDEKSCPLSIQSHFDYIAEIPQRVFEEISPRFSVKWERDFFGDIEGLFYQINGKTLAGPALQVQVVHMYLITEETRSEWQDDCTPHKREIQIPNLNYLFNFFGAPRDVVSQIADVEILDRYLRGDQVAPVFVGLLISVSPSPRLRLERLINKTFPEHLGQWAHMCSRVEIRHNMNGDVSVVHRGISTLTNRENRLGSISWSLEIKLLHNGYPKEILLNTVVDGDIPPSLGNLLQNRFVPPPLARRTVTEMFPKEGGRCIQIPEQGFSLNGSLIRSTKEEEILAAVQDFIAGRIPGSEAFRGIPEDGLKKSYSPIVRSLLVGFSKIPLLPVEKFVHNVRPLREGETWELSNISCKLDIDEFVVLRRTFCLRCLYRYLDLFQQEQVRVLSSVKGELILKYDVNGRPRDSRITILEHMGLDTTEIRAVEMLWAPSAGYETAQVLLDPSQLEAIVEDLSVMQTPVTIDGMARSLIDVSFMGEPCADGGNQSGLEVLMNRLGLPKELRVLSRNERLFGEKLRWYAQRQGAWEAFMKLLKLPVDIQCTRENIQSCLPILRHYLEDLAAWKQKVEAWKRKHAHPVQAAASPKAESQEREVEERECGRVSPAMQRDDRIREQEQFHECLRALGFTESFSEAQFLQKWREQDQEREITRFLFVLGLAGGRFVSACMANRVQLEACPLFSSIGDRWEHSRNHIDVGFWEGGFEISQEQRSSRLAREAADELACVRWSVTMRFDKDRHIIGAFSVVNEIQAPSVARELVEEAVSFLSSTWNCKGEAETVLPLVSPMFEAYKKTYPFPSQYVVRVPHSLVELSIREQALHRAMELSFNAKNIAPILNTVGAEILQRYLVQPGLVLEKNVSILHVPQSTVCMDVSDQTKLYHEVMSYLYCADNQRQNSCFRTVQRVIWKIELSLDDFGNPHAVTIAGLDKALISDTVTRSCEEILQKVRAAGTVTRSVGVSREMREVYF